MIGFYWVAGRQHWVLLFQNSCKSLLNGLFIKNSLYFKCTKPKGDFYWDLADPIRKRLAHPLLKYVIHLYWNSRAMNLTQDINIAVQGRAVLALTANITLRLLVCL